MVEKVCLAMKKGAKVTKCPNPLPPLAADCARHAIFQPSRSVFLSPQGNSSEILDARDTSGKAAIHWAACQNLGGCIKELWRQGASV